MTKKLLYKTTTAYLLFSLVLLLVSAPLFFYTIQRLYIEETDETLILHKNEFLKYSLPKLSTNEISNWNKYNRNVKIDTFKNSLNDTLFYNSYYDTLDAETEPYRELNAPILINEKPYTYVSRINLVETEDLILNVAFLFFIIISLLLGGLFIITKRLSLKLWKPFYETLNQIEHFEIDKSIQPKLIETGVEEFNRLNLSIKKLIEKNTSIYKNQREFIENAAHELQTPLAIFQAKIDTLIQSDDFTEDQNNLLNSLNESVSRLNRLNKNLLLLSKIENNSFIGKQTVSLKDVIDKQVSFFNEQAIAKNLKIEMELNGNTTVNSNSVLVEILISNLFLNAIRHNVPNGKVLVALTNDSLSFSNTGLPQTLVADKLFNRFSKSNSSEQGNGLGLAIIKKIADLNHWKITYSYSKNLHSFTVSF